MKEVKRLLVLEKRDEVFVFAYKPGLEARLLDALIDQAKDPRTDFDRFDVAVLEQKLKEVPPAGAPDLPQSPAPPKPFASDRFRQPSDGPLWFMRGLFGPDGDRPV